MMNVFTMCLLIATLAAASVWSPSPVPVQSNQHSGIVKEGHRVIVFEYERENMKESDLEKQPQLGDGDSSDSSSMGQKLKDKIEEAASVLPNVGQGVGFAQPKPAHSGKEIICDAFGKCKEKITSVLGGFRDKVADSAIDAMEGSKKGVKETGEKVAETFGKERQGNAENIRKGVLEEVKDVGKEAAKIAKEGVKSAVDTVKEGVTNAFESAKDAGENIKQAGGQFAEEAEDRVKSAVSSGKNAVGDSAKKACDRVKEAKEGLGRTVGGPTRDMTRKNLTEITREAREVAYDAYAYFLSDECFASIMSLIHLLAFATTYGICFWVTFISSHVLSRALPRHQFGMVQSKIYPVYFRSLAYGIGLSWLAHLLDYHGGRDVMQSYNLPWMLGSVLANLIYLEPRASKVMFERLKLEKEEGRGRDVVDMVAEPVTPAVDASAPTTNNGIGLSVPAFGAASPLREVAKNKAMKLNQRLKSLNTSSSFLNVLTLMGLTWHLVYLSQRLQITC